MAGYGNAYAVFQDKAPVLTRELLDPCEAASTLSMGIVDGMMNFCERGNIPPEAAWVNEIRFSEIDHYPRIQFGLSLRMEQLLHFKPMPRRRDKMGIAVKAVEINGQTYLNDLVLNRRRAEVLVRCPNLFDRIVEFVLLLRNYCVSERFQYESLRLSDDSPPTVNQQEMFFSIPFRVFGEIMDPEPKALIQEENELIEDLEELDFDARRKAGKARFATAVPVRLWERMAA